jgi:quercetin dioxygenase-like cupin family protein
MTEHLLQRHADIRWRPSGEVGIDWAFLRRNDRKGGTTLLRLAAGATFPEHAHPAGEEVFVVHGRIRVGRHLLEAGDYIFTPPGIAQDGEAMDDTILLMTSPEPIARVAPPEARP